MNPDLWVWIAPLALVLMLADWRQTVRIFAPGSKWRELNPIIKYSVLVPMLVKAMQEMHADFDTRLKALEV